jgi:tRNA modification GTPase
VENGKLDLTRAEAIADLVDAETPAQLRQALRQHDGRLADCMRLAHPADRRPGRAEAAIDFSDDGWAKRIRRARHAAQQMMQQIQEHLEIPAGEACARACA